MLRPIIDAVAVAAAVAHAAVYAAKAIAEVIIDIIGYGCISGPVRVTYGRKGASDIGRIETA